MPKHLIDKSALIAEIESRKKYAQTLGDNAINSSMQQFYDGMKQGCVDLLSFIDTLEVKEEILDKEGKTKLMRKCVHKAYKRGYDMGVLQTTNKMNHNTKEVDLDKELDAMITPELKFHKALPSLFDVAKHFFELGMAVNNKAQKGE